MLDWMDTIFHAFRQSSIVHFEKKQHTFYTHVLNIFCFLELNVLSQLLCTLLIPH